MNIETSEIKLAPKKLVAFLAMEYGMTTIACAIIVALLLGACALIFDARFWIVALIWIFIVIPMGLFLLFIIYGMLPLTSSNAVNHRIRFEKDSLSIIMSPATVSDEETPASRNEPTVTQIGYNLIQKINVAPDSLVVFFNPPHKGLIWIPAYSFPSKKELNDAFNLMKPYCKTKPAITIDYENSQG